MIAVPPKQKAAGVRVLVLKLPDHTLAITLPELRHEEASEDIDGGNLG